MDGIVNDERFKHIVKDSKFRILPKSERKFKVDKRFKNMFHDKKFKLKYSVDKRGRPVHLTTNDNLKKFYQLPSDDEDEQEEDENENANDVETKTSNSAKCSKDSDKEKVEISSEDDDTENESNAENKEEDNEFSSDDSSDSDSSVEDDYDSSVSEESGIEIPWNDFDKDAVRDDKTSSRIAVCNMDWDRIKAIDLFVLLNSFKAADGVIKSVKIYVSEYGKKRIEYEKMHGPQELTQDDNNQVDNQNNENNDEKDSDDEKYEEDEEGDKFDRFKLRQYQFNRLKYYYAIVECDTPETANKIYTECDGLEYESSCTRLDLRFVGDDVEFDEADLKEVCTEAPDPLIYKPNLFITTALNQTKVECTWDETPRDRLAITMKKYTEDELKNLNLKNLIATSSEEEDEDEENNREEPIKKSKNINKNYDNKNEKSKKKISQDLSKDDEPKDEEDENIKLYRDLLLGADNKKNKKKFDGGLEFSWEGGMEEEGFNELLFNKKKNNKNSKKSNKEKELTEEEKKEQAQLSLLTIDEDDGKAHFNLDDLLIDNSKNSTKKKKKLSKKNENKTIDDFKLNTSDPRFEAIFNDYKFNIDQSDQNYKKTKAMETLLEEKIKRKLNSDETEISSPKNKNDESISSAIEKNGSINLLVKSIKSKTEVLKRKKDEISNKKNKMLKASY